MKFYDISLELSSSTIIWPGDSKFKRTEKKTSAITSRLSLPTHFGTHIDAPKHFLFDKASVDKIPISKLIGKCQVIEVRPLPSPPQAWACLPARQGGSQRGEGSKTNMLIQLSDIKKLPIKAHDKILFKTRNSKLLKQKKFTANYVSLSLDAAKYLAQKKIDLVGIDYFGIEAKGATGHPVHKTLLRAGIVIIEGADLSKIKPGKYTIAALPLKIKAGDGSPARVVLWRA